jgi:hypothetical protein
MLVALSAGAPSRRLEEERRGHQLISAATSEVEKLQTSATFRAR